MPVKCLIKPSEYHDSVSLMLVARELAKMSGVSDAAVVMATEANKAILREAGLLTDDAQKANPNDMVIAVTASDILVVEQALEEADRLLHKKSEQDRVGEYRARTLRGAAKANPDANVAVISVAGRYAAKEAWDALHMGLHVLLFSDNVSIEDEILLKQYAVEHGLLLMGPGAGTAILNGVALGFANVIPPGPVGIVSAAGTGLQEVSTLLAKRGTGITQGIGTGGRDLKEAVGGLMMMAGLQALQDDPATTVIVMVSKPPASRVAQKVLHQAAQSSKPTVACFLGGDFSGYEPGANVRFANTLEEAASLAACLAIGEPLHGAAASADIDSQAASLRKRIQPGQRYLRGLFSGGTLCYEAQVVWRELLPEVVHSNAPLDDTARLIESNISQVHTVLDLGEEEFTVGRPHPMIDNDLRIRRLLREASDPQVAVIMLDVVLGFGAHPNPLSELAHAIRKARSLAAQNNCEPVFIASVTGTEADPQRLSLQVAALEEAGVIVCDSNAAAARLAAHVLRAI